MSKTTLYFKEVYSNFESFKEDVKDNLNIESDYLKDVYRRLMFKYGNSNINYYTRDEFKQAFMNELDNNLEVFLEKYKLYKSMINTTLEEIKIQNENITNNSEYTSTPTNVREAQNSYSSQVASFNKINELQAILQKHTVLLESGIKEFLTKFNYLFQYIYYDELELFIY